MEDFKIEKSISIPNLRKKSSQYPFMSMEIGDSFLIECFEFRDSFRERAKIIYHLKKTNKNLKNPICYCTRKEADSYNIRVWRTK